MDAWGDKASPSAFDTTVKLVLGDMGSFYKQFYDELGPGVLAFQPESKDAELIYMTIEMLLDWREWNSEHAQDIQKMIEVADKVNPLEKAAYLIVDHEGFRFIVIDYEKDSSASVIN